MMEFSTLLSVDEIRVRLRHIFPQGTPSQGYVTREMAAKTVFVMLYIDAIDGKNRWIRPDQITRMSDSQAELASTEDREIWHEDSLRATRGDIAGRWYAANTREPIRDETLRAGFVQLGAVTERGGLPTTSPLPRYALTREFASLFDPALNGEMLEASIERWRDENLSSSALARVAIVLRGAIAQEDEVIVTFPNGESRRMAPGESSVITKAVIEEFVPRFLERPAVIWLSESRNHVLTRDDELARAIGLSIQPDRNLPDLILVDLGPQNPLLIFVEVVASGGFISEARQNALLEVAIDGGFPEKQIAFVTAFTDRNDVAFRSSVDELAWRSFAWFISEPDNLIILRDFDRTNFDSLSTLM